MILRQSPVLLKKGRACTVQIPAISMIKKAKYFIALFVRKKSIGQ
jgi:hypothetical protein